MLVALVMTGCSNAPGHAVTGHPAAVEPAAMTPASSSSADSIPRVRGAVARIPGQPLSLPPRGLETHVAPDTPWVAQRPDPHTSYGSFVAARDHVEKTLRRLLGAYADSARWSRGTISFTYRDRMEVVRPPGGYPFWTVEDRLGPSRVPSLTMVLDTSTDHGPDVAAISAALTAEGWVEDGAFAADGTDGSTFGYVCREALCRVEGRWDGGDESDTSYTPAPGEHIELTCVPRVPEIRR
jgi:hypothetical protein